MSTPADKLRESLNVREFEAFLHARGFSRKEAQIICVLGFKRLCEMRKSERQRNQQAT